MSVTLRNLVACCTILLLGACNSTPSSTSPTPIVEDHSGHDHSHEETGPNGGHLVELLGNEVYHIEWTHDDETGLVTLYVLDEAAKELVPIQSDAITITAIVKDAIDYKLAAVEPSGDPLSSAKFELKSPELLVSLQMAGQGAEVTVALTVADEEYQGLFEHHEHGHHH